MQHPVRGWAKGEGQDRGKKGLPRAFLTRKRRRSCGVSTGSWCNTGFCRAMFAAQCLHPECTTLAEFQHVKPQRKNEAKQKNRQSSLRAPCSEAEQFWLCTHSRVHNVSVCWHGGILAERSPQWEDSKFSRARLAGLWPGHKGTVFLQSREVRGWERSIETVKAERGDGEVHSCLA